MGTDYNLLFGVLALQVELITHEQFAYRARPLALRFLCRPLAGA